MAERVHVFGGDRRWLQHDHARRWAAKMITGNSDISAEAGLAATYDEIMGGDDVAVGNNLTLIIRRSSEPLEYVTRVAVACDLLRRARRTMH
jgi:hypothetical protein